MKIIKYNKLIRDNIPEIMDKAGKEYTVSVLSDEEYIEKLKTKLQEEAKEVHDASKEEIIGELADVMEVVNAIEEYYSITHEIVLEKQNKKAITNGKFKKRLLLTEVRENDQ